MAKKPLQMGVAAPTIPQPRERTSEEIAERNRRASLSFVASPVAGRVAEAIVDLWDGSEAVIMETATHRLEVTVTPK